MKRIGVFICHCGTNIAAGVDIAAVVEAAQGMPGVVFATDYKYMCSEPGQKNIQEAIKEHQLGGVVVAACTPRMHEVTFRKALAEAGMNPYLLEIANLREQCSWVHSDKAEATVKAIDLVKMAVAKVNKNQPLFTTTIPIHKRALVVGGGIAGIQAALDIADAGYPVTIVEKEASVGGKMVMLDKTFPTMDCSACICTPKMVDVGQHPNITLMTYSEIESVQGYIGNFEVTIRQKAKYVDYSKCTGCGLCETKCPTKVTSGFEQGMAQRKAIYKLFPQAVPSKPVIDNQACRKLLEGKCGVCEKVCPLGCINFQDEDKLVTENFGAVILSTGYELIDWASYYGEYGGGRYPDVITGLQFERMVNASGPTDGKILRPSDGKEPKTVLIVKCVGSRDPHKGRSYCSRACCMYAAKHAHQVLDKITDSRCFVSYMDVRTPGKAYEEFYNRTLEDGAVYIRGRISKIYEENGQLVCQGEDTLIGRPVTITADLVVLETAMVPSATADKVAGLFAVGTDKDGWLTEAHPKLRPVETNTAGVFLCGVSQGPKDIPDTVAQASAAAVKVCGIFCHDRLDTNPMISKVDVEKCSGCAFCVKVCPYKALELVDLPYRGSGGEKLTRKVAQVNSGLCQGCGACVVSCRPGAIDLLGFTNDQILQEVDALCL